MALLYQQQGSPALARINTFQPNFLLLKTINFWSELLCSWWSHYRGIRHSHVYWQQHPLSLSPARAGQASLSSSEKRKLCPDNY